MEKEESDLPFHLLGLALCPRMDVWEKQAWGWSYQEMGVG